jgi:hypothetical protein
LTWPHSGWSDLADSWQLTQTLKVFETFRVFSQEEIVFLGMMCYLPGHFSGEDCDVVGEGLAGGIAFEGLAQGLNQIPGR